MDVTKSEQFNIWLGNKGKIDFTDHVSKSLTCITIDPNWISNFEEKIKEYKESNENTNST